MTPLYTTSAIVTGGREGTARSEDGNLDVALSTPRELGGAGGQGTNPEQMFAAGYAACFLSAMKLVASQDKIALPADVSVAAKVGIGANDSGIGYSLAVDLDVRLAGMDAAMAEALLEKTHQVCPYSNATRGNINVGISAS